MPNDVRRRNDDYEEFGARERPVEPTRTPIENWAPGMIGVCGFCGLIARLNERVRRPDGSAGCPRCGGTFAVNQEDQARTDAVEIDLTRNWRAGSTGRCNRCGLVARVFDDVRREDGTASCEMCGAGTFEFVYGLPASPFRAPGPRADFEHQIDGMSLRLRRRVSDEFLRTILDKIRTGASVEVILADTTLHSRFNEQGFTRFTVDEIRKAENLRRWIAHEPLLYTDQEKERLKNFVMLRVPFNGRVKIQFAGLHGAQERWVNSATFDEIRDGRRVLVFDGHYKAVEASRMAEDPRFQVARQFFAKCNALLGRGLIRAWSATGEEIPLGEAQPWTPEVHQDEPPRPAGSDGEIEGDGGDEGDDE